MVEFMVRLLETGTEALENPAATKAQIVKAIKAMQNSLTYGDQVGVTITNGISNDTTFFLSNLRSSSTE